ncbi:MAG: argininosuccinate lyase [Candidatus Bathyarchaeia archaeon]
MDILRGDRLDKPTTEIVDYTTSVVADTSIVKPVIEINKAHVIMLVEQGIVAESEGALLLKALSKLDPNMKLDPSLEDVHMNIEAEITKMVGEDIGGKLHTAKSRNDQVATAIRITLRQYLLDIIRNLIELRRALLKRCVEHLNIVMPGYTHLQHAQPVTLAHYFLAYHDAIERDTTRLMNSYQHVNLCPMGAAALAATGYNINRNRVAELLGFDGILENSIDAVSSRDFAVEAMAALALSMTDFSRIAEELILWSSVEFGTAEIPDEYASASSIMPQKRNPVVPELIRAKATHVYGDLVAAFTILKALPLSYNLDLQELTPHLWNTCQITLTSTRMLTGLIQKTRFNASRWLELVSKDFSTATDLADTLVKKFNIPFRMAHRVIGVLVQRLISEGKTLHDTTPQLLEEIFLQTTGRKLAIKSGDIAEALDPIKSINSKTVRGCPSPSEVARMAKERRKRIIADEAWLRKKAHSLKKAELKLRETAEGLSKYALQKP